MNMKQVTELTGVTADTIRYYERIGLIPPVKRKETGVRDFDEEDIRWIEFTRQMREARISVESLIEYISLFKDHDDATIPARVELLVDERNQLEERIHQMQIALERLDYKINNYENHVVPKEKSLRGFDKHQL